MSSRMSSYRLAAVAGVMASATSMATAQDISVTAIPDYDQKRAAVPEQGILGLPNNGSMYCVPTAAMNFMTYIANRGYPGVLPGPGNYWGGGDNYNHITSRLQTMGLVMSTSATGGTGGSEASAGLAIWLETGAPGKFVRTRFYADDNTSPTYASLVVQHLLGGLVMQRIGWYDQVSPGVFTRDGGHLTSWCGVDDPFTSQARMYWRDPASDEGSTFLNLGLLVQSPYTTNSSFAVNTWATFDGDVRLQSRMTGYNSPAFIDGYISIRPKFGFTNPPLPSGPGGIVMNPNPTHDDSPDAFQTLPSPNGQPVVDAVLSADLASLFMLTQANGATGTPARLSRVELHDQRVSGAIDLPGAPDSLCTSRDHTTVFCKGEIEVLSYSWGATNAPTAPSGRAVIADPNLGPVCFDDTRDEVVAYSPASHALLIWPEDLGDDPATLPLPPGAAVGGKVCVVVDPDGCYWVSSETGPAIHCLVMNAAGGLMVRDSVPTPGGCDSRVHVSEGGSVMYVKGGVIQERQKDGDQWIDLADSDFAGLPGGSILEIATSRTNWEPEMAHADFNVEPDEFPGEIADCTGDLNADGVVDFDDLNEVLANFTNEGEPGLAGDVNADGVVDFDDLNAVLTNYGTICNPT